MPVDGAASGSLVGDGRLLDSGDEAGTAPGDRGFRPDVEGLRAVAVLLVVLYHAGVPGLTGGYVGVDVFFVISGFVITGLLLREHRGTGGTSILDFYARRVRRILPAATLVILAAVVAACVVLGVVSGNSTADDGRWAAVFLANFHFESVGTNYLSANLPPSPLQNYWSLSVEEQFYVVYPTLFLLTATVGRRFALRVRLTVLLVVIIVASFWLSVVQTASHPAAAYFSPFTRAWELALGALVAVSTSWLRNLGPRRATVLTWAGLASVACAACTFTSQTAYPGSLVAVPVVGAALVIAGGAAAPRWGVESLLGLGPAQWLGKRSYSLYLWHWPILTIAAEQVGRTVLPTGDNLVLVLVALGLSMWTYRAVENPVRQWRLPSRQSVTIGLALVGATVITLSAVIAANSGPSARSVVPAANTAAVLDQVAAAGRITQLPDSLHPSLANAIDDFGGDDEPHACSASLPASRETICTLGDTTGKQLVVVYGDSHALMWLPAFNGAAHRAHWRLIVMGKDDCPAALLTPPDPPGVGRVGAPYVACAAWHRWALATIARLHPNLVVVSTQDLRWPAAYWSAGITPLYRELAASGARIAYLANIPLLPQAGPECLAAHPHDVQHCSASLRSSRTPSFLLNRTIATRSGVQYIDPTPWLCSSVCTAVIGHVVVYLDQFHLTATYAGYLQNALGASLGLPSHR